MISEGSVLSIRPFEVGLQLLFVDAAAVAKGSTPRPIDLGQNLHAVAAAGMETQALAPSKRRTAFKN